jgi:hypothetical protein
MNFEQLFLWPSPPLREPAYSILNFGWKNMKIHVLGGLQSFHFPQQDNA